MANRVQTFKCTIPRGTLQTAPLTVNLPFDEGDVEKFEIVIPDGVAGLAAFYIAKGGQQVIPANSGQWIVSNDEKIEWELTEQPEGTGWQLVGYNTDIYDHSFYVRVLVSDYHAPVAVSPVSEAFSLPPVTLPFSSVTA